MKALLISNLFPTEGAPSGGIFVQHRIRSLEDLGAQVESIALRPRPFPLRFKHRNPVVGNSFEQLRTPISPMDAWRVKAGRIAWSGVPRAAKALAKRAENVDIIVGHGMYGLPAAGVAGDLSARMGIPAIGVFHGSDINFQIRADPARAVAAMQRLRAAVFVSRSLLDAARSVGYDGRATVIPNGIDPRVFGGDVDSGPIRSELSLSRATRIVSYVGNLLPVKGADRLPAIIGELSNLTTEFHLAVMGDGPELARLKKEMEFMPVTWLGRRQPQEVAALLAMTDVVILPSRSEGWPCVVMEAFGSGASVVGANVGGMAEAIGDGGSVVEEGGGFSQRFASAVERELRLKRPRQTQRGRVRGYSWRELALQELKIWAEVT